MENVKDIYIKYKGHPKFTTSDPETSSATELIVNKMEMLLFTNKNEVFDDPNFGCDLPVYLWQTQVNSSFIKESIIEQFNEYIPELQPTDYKLDIYIYPGVLQDILVIDIKIDEVEINAIFR